MVKDGAAMDRITKAGVIVFAIYIAVYVMAWVLPVICEWIIFR